MKTDAAEAFSAILALPEGLERTAALVEWFQNLYAPAARPILVGGAAAEIFSKSAYTTGDFDFVGELPPEVIRNLEEVGFTLQGRSWIHEEGQVFIELPGLQLMPGEEALWTRVGGRMIFVLSPEDTLVDRLAAWQFWKSSPDGVAAFWIWQNFADSLDLERLEQAVERSQVKPALTKLREFVESLGGGEPEAEEVELWAKTKF